MSIAFIGFVILIVLGFKRRKKKDGNHKKYFIWSVALLAVSLVSYLFVDDTKFQPTAEELAAQEEEKDQKAKEKEEAELAENKKEEQENAEKEAEEAKIQKEQEAQKLADEKEAKEEEAKKEEEKLQKEKEEQEAKEKEEAEKAKADKEAKEKATAKKKENNSIENRVKNAVHKSFGEKNDFDKKDSIVNLSFNKDKGYLSLQVFGQDSLTTNMIKTGMWIKVTDVLENLVKEKDIKDIDISIIFPMQDQYGKQSNDTVMSISFSRETIDKIDFGNFQHDNIPNVADEYWHHPIFNK